MSSIGSLTIEMSANIARLQKDMDDMKRSVGGAMKDVQQAVDMAKKAFVLFAGVASINAFKGMIDGAIQGTAALHDLSQQTGASVAALGQLRSIGGYTETSIDSIAGAMGKLSKSMSASDEDSKGAAVALKALGINFDEFRRLGPDAQMIKVAQAMGGFADGANKSAAAQALFGKEGAKLLPFMADLAEGADKVNAKLTDQEIAFKRTQAAMADAFGDNMTLLRKNGEAWKKDLAMGMLPALWELSEAMLKVTNSAGGLKEQISTLSKDGTVAEWVRSVIDLLSYVVDDLQIIVRLAQQVGDAFATVGNKIADRLSTPINAIKLQLSGNFAEASKLWDQYDARRDQADADYLKRYEDRWSKPLLGAQLREQMAKVKDTAPAAPPDRPQVADIKGITDAAAAAAKAQAEYDKLIASIRDKTAADQAEINSGEKLTEAQKQAIEIMVQLRDGKLQLNRAQAIGLAGELELRLSTEATSKAMIERTAQAKKWAEGFATYKADIDARTQALQQELDLGRPLNEVEKEQIRLDKLVQEGKINMIDAMGSEIAARRTALTEAQAALAWQQQATKENDEAVSAMLKHTETLQAEIEKQREANAVIGLNAEQIAALESAKLRETAATKERTAALMDEIDWSGQLGAEYRKQAQALRDLADLKDQGGAAKAAQAAAEEWKKAMDQVGQSLTDALMRSFESGKSFGKTFLDSLKNAFKSTVLRLAIQPIVAGSIGSLGALLGMPAQAGGMGGAAGGNPLGLLGSLGGAGGQLGGLSGIFSAGSTLAMNGGTGMALEGAGSMLAGGQIGAGLAQGAGALAPWAAAVMAGGSIGRGISGGRGLFGSSGTGLVNMGMAAGAIFGGPIGAAIGGAAAGVINRAFGTGAKQVGATGITGTLGGAAGAASLQGFQDWSKKGGWFSSGSSGTDLSTLSTDITDTFSAAVRTTQAATRDYAAALGLSTSAVTGYSQAVRISLQGLTDQQQQDAITKALSDFSDGLAKSLGTALDAVAQRGETASQTLARLGSSITTVNDTLSVLGQRMLATSVAGGDAASKLLDAFGGAQAFQQSTAAYEQAFYSEAERAAATTKQLTAALAGLGLTLPNTLADYRKLVEAQDLTTAAGRTNYASLLALSGTFATLRQATDALAQAGIDAAAAAGDAAGSVGKLSDAMMSASTSVLDEIKRLRGAGADAGTLDAAALQAKFATTTAQARAGDAAALQALPEISKALEAAATATATSTADGARLRAWLTGSLADTLKSLGVTVPAFAAGGLHAGGLAIVGERGPELAAMGPARIYTASQTQAMLTSASAGDNTALMDELRALRAEVASLRASHEAGSATLAYNTRKTAYYLERVIDGTDAVRTTT